MSRVRAKTWCTQHLWLIKMLKYCLNDLVGWPRVGFEVDLAVFLGVGIGSQNLGYFKGRFGRVWIGLNLS